MDYMDVHTTSMVSSQEPNDVATLKEQHSILSMWTEPYKTAEREPDETIRWKWRNFSDTLETQLQKLSLRKSRPDTDQEM